MGRPSLLNNWKLSFAVVHYSTLFFQMDHTKQLIRIAILNACSKHVRAWVDHYDAGEDGKFLST